MKHFYLLLLLMSFCGFSQKTFIDQPYLETTGKVDTLVVPDKIYLNILIAEKDTKGKMSIDQLETKLFSKLSQMGIDIKTQLSVKDLSSNFKKYFLREQDVLKAKQFSLLVYNADTAGKVFEKLEEENISNVSVSKTEYSKLEQLKLNLKELAVKKAKLNAQSLLKPLNQKLGNVIFISDADTNIFNSLQGRVSGITVRGTTSANAGSTSFMNQPEIEFEKLRVETSVIVKFKIE